MAPQLGKDWTAITFDEGRELLKKWRESNARRSEEVVEVWEHVISRSPSQLADELWVVYEQVCIAALDNACDSLAVDCIEALKARFPNSNRVAKLTAMLFEYREQYKAADEIYDRLLEMDPTNNIYRKRKIAILIAQNKRLDAIKELNDYLKTFLNDSEAWIQLSDLFMQENDLAKAAHCIEECVLAAPLNTLYLRRLADIRYTQGDNENVELAKSYYEQAVKLNPTDLRAQFGIVLCSNQLSTAKGCNTEKKKELNASAANAVESVLQRYQELKPVHAHAALVESAIEQMKTSLVMSK